MKISNSKKQMARIISENGGWREGNYAAQDKDDKKVWFMHRMIGRPDGASYWPGVKSKGIPCGKVLPNWHQTILSRDEYFHLYPAPDADGWIEWKGGECPIDGQTMIDVKFRYGACATSGADCFNFTHDDHKASDIIAYRLHKLEQQKSTAIGDDETNLAAKEELEALEFSESPEQRAKLAKIYAPSIEQLAADYKAKLAIARRAQEEADSHRCGAEAALEKLYQAGLAIGLVLSIAAPESELVITDWRDLQVGDVIWCCGEDELAAGEYIVLEVEEPSYDGVRTVLVNGSSDGQHWIDSSEEWRFIRRPAKGGVNA